MTSAPAYAIDGRPVDSDAFYAAACDAQRSVVVEACAGAGKTWMLVSRILRALLDGAEPRQIVAITFTRKAAGEMRSRLEEWLDAFAAETGFDDAGRARELQARGLDAAAAAALAPALGALQRRVLEAGQGVSVLTFHAWFAQLLMHSPLALRAALGLPAQYELIEQLEPLRAALLRRFHERVRRDEALRALYAALVRRHGRHQLLGWLDAAWGAAGDLMRADAAGTLEDAVPPASALWPELLPECAGLDEPAGLLASARSRDALVALAAELGRATGVKKQDAARGLVDALQALDRGDAVAAADCAWEALFTKDGTPRKQLGDHPLLAEMVDRLQSLRTMQAQQAAHDDHRAMTLLSRVLLAEYAALKRERGLVDMSDLDRAALHLLGEGAHAAWLQERLDLRLRHLLIDEFQDTSPAQWQVLQGWLSAYAGAGGGASGRQPLSVFLVGDPKQSIYRFRGAEPRVFVAARQLVVEAFDGLALSCDHTRRSAPALIEAVNAVFSPLASTSDGIAFGPFRPHTTASKAAGAVWALPLLTRPEKAPAAGRTQWRDSLTEPRREPEQQRRAAEAAQAARAVATLLTPGGPQGPAALAPGEIMVLSRRREMLGEMAAALATLGVPHALAEPLDLMRVPEVADLVAVLDVLASPGHDLALARALKSPLFGAADDELLTLAQTARAEGGAWLDALRARSWPSGPATAALDRARALFDSWSALVHTLPPHDLLDRICDEADAALRFAAAVPASRRTFALQAIDALLAAALEHDGGRFASTYGFVRELRAGRVRAERPTAAGAVQLLTVHGAKGLEARAVVLLDCDPAPPASRGPALLIDWPAEAAAPRSAAFVRSETDLAPSLQALGARRRDEAEREELNALYVAATRACEWLLLSATEASRRGAGPSWWQRLSPQALPWPAGAEVPAPVALASPGSPVAAAPMVAVPMVAVPVVATVPVVPRWSGAAAGPASSLSGVQRAVHQGMRELRTPPRDPAAALIGEALHRVLEWAGTAPAGGARWSAEDRSRACDAAASTLHLPQAAWPRLRAAVDAVLDSPQCAPFFDRPSLRWAGAEVTLALDGEVLRPDRVVLRDEPDGATWWVLDVKLEAAPERDPDLVAQLRRYVAALGLVQPGARVRAAFITGHGRRIELAP